MSKCLLFVGLVAVLLVGTLSGQESKPDPRTESVKMAVVNYAKAFNKKDLEAVSKAWSEDCTYQDKTTGDVIEGRKAMAADLEKGFKAQPKSQLSVDVDRVKFITNTVVQIQGQTVVHLPGEDTVAATYSAILVQQGKGWQIHTLEEAAVPEPETPFEALKELEWLLGKWVDDANDSRVETNVRWAANGAFLLRSYAVQTNDGPDHAGTQIIGWDPRAKQFRSWTFNSDGSFGQGFWSKNGKDWLIKSSQTLADGQAASGTYVMTPLHEDALQIELIGHTIAGKPQPGTGPIMMVRPKAEPEEKTESNTKTESPN